MFNYIMSNCVISIKNLISPIGKRFFLEKNTSCTYYNVPIFMKFKRL